MGDTVTVLLELIDKAGVVALLIIITVTLGYWITYRTVPKELYEEHKKDVEDLRTEFREVVGPTFDMITKMLAQQDRINNELIRNLDNQAKVLGRITRDLSDVKQDIKRVEMHEPKMLADKSLPESSDE